MFNIVLVEPEIPQNAGNIARTCAATGTRLHMIRPLGFEVSDKYLKRAGLDYWNLVEICYYDSFDELREKYPDGRFFYFTTKGRAIHSEATFQDGDFLVFGKETKGLPEELLLKHKGECLRIPMFEQARSLNLSNSVAVALYEALRQTGYNGLLTQGELHNHSWEESVIEEV
jgi:tRNA (cytidine/uridine-2'-O-)-methyltransferase